MDGSHKILVVERFDEVHLSPTIVTFELIRRSAFGAEKDDFRIFQFRIGAYTPGDLEPVHTRHHDIEYDNVRFVQVDLLQSFQPVEGFFNAVTFTVKQKFKGDNDVGFVIDQ